MNHAVLFVRDADRTARFYEENLGFKDAFPTVPPGARFLRAPASTNDHDLGLFTIGEAAGASAAGRSTVGLYHISWEVETLGDMQEIAQRLTAANALVGASDHSTTKALYAHDPDGLEFEVTWVVPDELLDESTRSGAAGIKPLDLAKEIQRYGANTPGGGRITRLPAVVR
jgi:catechol-2,3-dioxygenase